MCWCGFGHARVCGTLILKFPFDRSCGGGGSGVILLCLWVIGEVGRGNLGLGEGVLGMEFGVGVGMGMPEFTVHLCFAIPLCQKLVRWRVACMYACMYVYMHVCKYVCIHCCVQ